MTTVDDLRNPKRKSGFDHVSGPRRDRHRPSYFGHSKAGGTKLPSVGSGTDFAWRGSRRATAEEAAQDYCDYVNGLTVAAPTTLTYPGHPVRPKSELPSEVKDALGVLRDHKAQRAGRQGYVYLIGVKGDFYAVKIGYSVNPEARVGELQTGNPRELYLLAKMPGTLADEKAIHAQFKHLNLVGEWFKGNLELISVFDDHRVARREP